MKSFRSLTAWNKRCGARPAFGRVMARENG